MCGDDLFTYVWHGDNPRGDRQSGDRKSDLYIYFFKKSVLISCKLSQLLLVTSLYLLVDLKFNNNFCFKFWRTAIKSPLTTPATRPCVFQPVTIKFIYLKKTNKQILTSWRSDFRFFFSLRNTLIKWYIRNDERFLITSLGVFQDRSVCAQ